MSLTSSALSTTVGLQSTAMMGRAAGMAKMKKGKPLSTKKMIKGFTDIMVGTALIKPTASIVKTIS